MKIPYYRNGIKNSFCNGFFSLEDFIQENENPSPEQAGILKGIEEATKDGDKKRKTALKEKLLFFTPSVEIPVGKKRRYSNISSFTGLAQLDFDDIDKELAIDLKGYLFDNYKQIYTSYLSPSKKGVKAIIRIPICKSVDEFQDYYRAITEEFEVYDGFDPSPKNAVLPLFLSHDKFLRSRKDAKIWDIKKTKKTDLREKYPIPQKPYISSKKNDKKKARAINTLRKMINGIVDSPGHYQLRSACLIFGTRVGFGYVDYYEALSEIEHLVRTNNYLSKGVDNYLKTAKWALEEGIKTPKPY